MRCSWCPTFYKCVYKIRYIKCSFNLPDEYIFEQSISSITITLPTPDYNNKVNISTPYTPSSDGFIMYNSAGTGSAVIGDVTIPVGGNDSYNEGPVFLPIEKGKTLTSMSTDAGTPIFVPYKQTTINLSDLVTVKKIYYIKF